MNFKWREFHEIVRDITSKLCFISIKREENEENSNEKIVVTLVFLAYYVLLSFRCSRWTVLVETKPTWNYLLFSLNQVWTEGSLDLNSTSSGQLRFFECLCLNTKMTMFSKGIKSGSWQRAAAPKRSIKRMAPLSKVKRNKARYGTTLATS